MKRQRQRKEVQIHLLGYRQNRHFTVFPCIPQGTKKKKVLVLEATQSKLAKALDANLICMLSPNITVSMQLQ